MSDDTKKPQEVPVHRWGKTQPHADGKPVLRVSEMPWQSADDVGLDAFEWTVVGRARVEWALGGVANGLLLRADDGTTAVVIWERPREPGPGAFKLLPVGEW